MGHYQHRDKKYFEVDKGKLRIENISSSMYQDKSIYVLWTKQNDLYIKHLEIYTKPSLWLSIRDKLIVI